MGVEAPSVPIKGAKESAKELEKVPTKELSTKKPKTKEAPKKTPGRKRKDNDNIFMSEMVQSFTASSAKRHKMEVAKTKEMQRHNEVMEELAWKEHDLKQRQAEFDFKVKRLEQYKELKDKFHVEFIESVFPEFKDFVDADRIMN